MFTKSIFKSSSIMLLFFCVYTQSAYSQKITMYTLPSTANAEIIINGQKVGTKSYVLKVPKKGGNTPYSVEVNAPGFLSQSFSVTPNSMKNPYPIELFPDPLYNSTTQSDILNKDNTLNVKSGRTKEEAWKIVVATILDRFDVLEVNDERSGYLRTSWVGTTFSSNTIRVRVIVKLSTEDPLVYKFKFISEESGKGGTAFSADELYQPYNRMQKKYDGFLDELMTKLRN